MDSAALTYDLRTLAADWAWLIELSDFTLLQISPFGDLFLRDFTGAHCLLDINLGALEYATDVGSDPAILFRYRLTTGLPQAIEMLAWPYRTTHAMATK